MQSPNAIHVGSLTTLAASKSITWSIYAGVIERGQDPKTDAMPINDDWYNDAEDLPEDLVAFVIKIRQFTGSDVVTVCDPTIVEKGKNRGKKNQTNAFTQALKDAKSELRKRADKKSTNYVHPMLATDLELPDLDKLEYPIAVQEKLDGLRVIVTPATKDSPAALWSRGGKPFPIPAHLAADVEMLGATGLIWDGEFYGKDPEGRPYPLQLLQGATRGAADKNDTELEQQVRGSLFICIFDIVLPETSYSERSKIMAEKFPQIEHCRIIETFIASGPEEVEAMFHAKIAEGLEGLILRVLTRDSFYEESINGKRSKNLYKLKAEYSAEGIIREVIQGKKGRDIGAAIFVVSTLPETFPERFRDRPSVTFSVVPNLPLVERKVIYKKPAAYVGKLYTFTFQEVSNSGEPLRAKGVSIREPGV
jgi:hypothetical protein